MLICFAFYKLCLKCWIFFTCKTYVVSRDLDSSSAKSLPGLQPSSVGILVKHIIILTLMMALPHVYLRRLLSQRWPAPTLASQYATHPYQRMLSPPVQSLSRFFSLPGLQPSSVGKLVEQSALILKLVILTLSLNTRGDWGVRGGLRVTLNWLANGGRGFWQNQQSMN